MPEGAARASRLLGIGQPPAVTALPRRRWSTCWSPSARGWTTPAPASRWRATRCRIQIDHDPKRLHLQPWKADEVALGDLGTTLSMLLSALPRLDARSVLLRDAELQRSRAPCRSRIDPRR
ncbi:MAG: hypothetical protein R3F59_07625 [Myxococcota bacterium]